MWHSRVINVVLLVLVIMGALSVVTSQHKARKLFISLQQEKDHAHQMEVEWGQLQLEQSTWAAPARVETIASQKLQMQTPKKEQIRFIRIGQVAETRAADVAAKTQLAGQSSVQAQSADAAETGNAAELWEKLKKRLNGSGQ
ncbi:MAG: cell division protein FtsL [Gallionella sp.]|jgi:cell division protein FtsL